MEATSIAKSPGDSNSSTSAQLIGKRRPCDACRKRKSRCESNQGDTACVLCRFHRQPCLFNENPRPRKKSKAGIGIDGAGAPTEITRTTVGRGSKADFDQPSSTIRQTPVVKDYATLKGPSLLKKTLGLQNHRYSKFLGSTSEFEPQLVKVVPFCDSEDLALGATALRRVSAAESFLLIPDEGALDRNQEVQDLDDIETVVAPHGQALIHLYFRIVHPSFPILHKKVFLEKYERTHREFSPPLLAAVYILALNWWSYSSDLSLLPKPNVFKLEQLALKTLSYVACKPKLSTIQAGLLLLQRQEGDSWALTGKLVAIGQELGLHLDCTRWRIPSWEKGLRKRLAWGLYMQDKWGSLVHGRPSHITNADWMVKRLTENDFPERAADEDNEEGSTEVENGRLLFCEMIDLTEIVADILWEFYTSKAEEELEAKSSEGVRWVLERAKPIQVRLKNWYSRLPNCLRMDHVRMRKLNSAGYLHISYFTAEITLHRRILRSLAQETDESLVSICRSAANARLESVIEFGRALRPEHLQSFWYSATKYGFAVVGSFISLLWMTASTQEEAVNYVGKLEEYRWTLRLSSKSADFLERALAMLATSTGTLLQHVSDTRFLATESGSRDFSSEHTFDEERSPDVGNWDDVEEMGPSPTQYSTDQIDFLCSGFSSAAPTISDATDELGFGIPLTDTLGLTADFGLP